MSIEENKRVALDFFKNLSAGNGDALIGLLADSAVWWVQGSLPFSGTKTKQDFAGMVEQLLPAIEQARVIPKGVTAEGDRVAVEAESSIKLVNGKIMRGTYHFLFVIRNGKIYAGKEYMDTDHARDVLVS